MSKTKKKSSAGKKVAVFFIVLIIIEILAIVGVTRVFKNDDVTPSFAGYSVFLMDSAKMENDVPKNTLVLAEEVSPSKDKIGKAVLCENVPGIGTSVFWLADVVSKGENIDGVIYKVYQGDDSENIYEVKAKDVVGVATSYYTTVGKIIRFVKSYVGMAICVAIPLLFMIVLEIIIAIAKHSSSRKQDNDEYDVEDEEEEDETLEDFLNETHGQKYSGADSDEDGYDISFAKAPVEEIEEPVEEEEFTEAVEEEEVPEEDEITETEEIEVQETAPKSQPRDAEDSVSSTRKTASASLEELMKMMEEEQQRLKDQLK